MIPMIELKSELEGIIKLEIIKEDGTLKEADGLNIPFKNLITDSGLNFIAGSSKISDAASYCRVGTGSTVPSVLDTALNSQTGSTSSSGTSTNSVQYTTQPYYSQHQIVYTFAVGDVSGNLTEIGFFPYSTGGPLWSRALIKDSGGNPTTLTLLATEQLKVTYTVIRYIPEPQTGTFTLNTNGTNSTVTYTITPANITDSSCVWKNGRCSFSGDTYLYVYETNTLGPITSKPSGSSSPLTLTADSYTSGSFQRTSTITIPISTANFTTGIGSLLFWNYNNYSETTLGYQCSFSPKIMKTASQTLAIGIKLSWGRTTAQ